jgi:hypothetical protein
VGPGGSLAIPFRGRLRERSRLPSISKSTYSRENGVGRPGGCAILSQPLCGQSSVCLPMHPLGPYCLASLVLVGIAAGLRLRPHAAAAGPGYHFRAGDDLAPRDPRYQAALELGRFSLGDSSMGYLMIRLSPPGACLRPRIFPPAPGKVPLLPIELPWDTGRDPGKNTLKPSVQLPTEPGWPGFNLDTDFSFKHPPFSSGGGGSVTFGPPPTDVGGWSIYVFGGYKQPGYPEINLKGTLPGGSNGPDPVGFHG